MVIQSIKSEDFKDSICVELDKYLIEDVIDEDLDKIEDFTLNRYRLSGELTDIDVNDLKFLKNLKSLTIIRFDIDDNFLSIINSISSLENIQFSYCNFSTNMKISPKINYLVIDNPSSFNVSILNNNNFTRIINCEIDLKNILDFSNIQALYLQNCKISNIEMLKNYNSLETLNIDGSTIDNTQFIDELSKKIKVRYLKDFYPTEEN